MDVSGYKLLLISAKLIKLDFNSWIPYYMPSMKEKTIYTDLSEPGKRLINRAIGEAYSFKVSEVDTGFIAIALLDDKALRMRHNLVVDIHSLREVLRDLGGYPPEQMGAISFSPAVYDLKEVALAVAQSNGLTLATPESFFSALRDESAVGIGAVLLRRVLP